MSFKEEHPDYKMYNKPSDLYFSDVPYKAWSELESLIDEAGGSERELLVKVLSIVARITRAGIIESGVVARRIPDVVSTIRKRVGDGKFNVFMDCLAVLYEEGDLTLDSLNEFLEDNEFGYRASASFGGKVCWEKVEEDSFDAEQEMNNIQQSIVDKGTPNGIEQRMKGGYMRHNTKEKKYQVFVSSTYEDLKEERSAVIQTLLDLGCIPVGMEQFPASGMSQMDYIKKMLETCDYFILILAGRYGSVDPTDGIGYTEKEYDYAVIKKIPVMSFIIEDIGKLPNEKCETTDERRKLLKAFRAKVSASRMIKKYYSKESLQAGVAISLQQCIKDFPAVGWVRADGVDTDSPLEAMLDKYMKEHTATIDDIDVLFDK